MMVICVENEPTGIEVGETDVTDGADGATENRSSALTGLVAVPVVTRIFLAAVMVVSALAGIVAVNELPPEAETFIKVTPFQVTTLEFVNPVPVRVI
jgi:hypothetical protein